MITELLDKIDSVLYYPILIVVMALAGIYFTVLTKGVQIRLFGESLRLLKEPPEDKKNVSSLQAMLVSTASRVGTGNIIGVSTAICLGGPGACFWMWIMCIIGASSAFIESTLAQIYKRRNDDGECYGGGITFGYDFNLGRHWSLDLHAGVAPVYYNHRRSFQDDVLDSPTEYKEHGIAILPLQVGVSFVYIIK